MEVICFQILSPPLNFFLPEKMFKKLYKSTQLFVPFGLFDFQSLSLVNHDVFKPNTKKAVTMYVWC